MKHSDINKVYGVVDYAAFMAQDPYIFNLDYADLKLGGLVLAEHPQYGDESPVFAIDHKNKLVWNTGFYDPQCSEVDQMYIVGDWVTLLEGSNNA